MEESKLYYLASLTSSDLKLMAEPCYKNDAKIDNHTLIYFPVLTLLNELSNPIHFDFSCYSYIILFSHSFFSLNKSILYCGVQIARILSSRGN